MKKIVLYVFLLISTSVISQEVKDSIVFEVQGINWNDTKKTSLQKDNDLTIEGKYGFKDLKVGGLDATFVIVFTKTDSIKAIAYGFNETHTNENIYIEDYNSVKKQLTAKYGEPKEDDYNWRNTLFENDKSNHGFAISKGDLELSSKWYLEDTIIMLTLSGDNYKINHRLTYINKKLHKETTKSDF